MNKRGSDTAVNPLIWIALGVFVLIILMVLFRDQIFKGSKSYTALSDQASLDEAKCTFILGRACRERCLSTEEPVTVAPDACKSPKATCCQIKPTST